MKIHEIVEYQLVDNNIQPGDIIFDKHLKRVFVVLTLGNFDICLGVRPVWCLTNTNKVLRLSAD